MKIDGVWRRTIQRDGDGVLILDQTLLPHHVAFARLGDLEEVARAISSMQVRGAPLIGVAAAYGMALAMGKDGSDQALGDAFERLLSTRPTAVNLRWALERMRAALAPLPAQDRASRAFSLADFMAEEDVACNQAIGRAGLELISEIWERRRAAGAERVNILTHCNAGWLATVDWGTALAPIYCAQQENIPVHVWVDETRPRNQGAALTASELSWQGIPYTVIADNCGGYLMRQGMVDLCIVGADRIAANGDVCNKIGTYLKALAAFDARTPFYAAAPGSTIDWRLECGDKIPIEVRSEREVSHICGVNRQGEMVELRLVPEGAACFNPGFDVTPARLVSGLITERGVCPATRQSLSSLFHEG